MQYAPAVVRVSGSLHAALVIRSTAPNLLYCMADSSCAYSLTGTVTVLSLANLAVLQ
jgi:hypothetical protein